MPHELTKNLKIVVLKNHHLLLVCATTMNHFSAGLWHVMKSRFYTTDNDQLNGWTERRLQSTSQGQTCTSKGAWSLFGALLPVWSTTALWIPAKPWNLRRTLSKWVRCPETAALALANRKGATLCDNAQLHVQPTKGGWIGLRSSASAAIFTWLLPTNYHFLKHLDKFLQGKRFHNQRRQEMLSKSSSNPKAWSF